MTSECPGRRKLSQSIPHHTFSHQYVHENPSVMHTNYMSHKLRRDLTSPFPRLDDIMIPSLFLFQDFLHQLHVYIWSFFNTSTHNFSPSFRPPAGRQDDIYKTKRYFFLLCTIILFEYFFLFRRLPTAGRPANVFGAGIPMPLRPS